MTFSWFVSVCVCVRALTEIMLERSWKHWYPRGEGSDVFNRRWVLWTRPFSPSDQLSLAIHNWLPVLLWDPQSLLSPFSHNPSCLVQSVSCMLPAWDVSFHDKLLRLFKRWLARGCQRSSYFQQSVSVFLWIHTKLHCVHPKTQAFHETTLWSGGAFQKVSVSFCRVDEETLTMLTYDCKNVRGHLPHMFMVTFICLSDSKVIISSCRYNVSEYTHIFYNYGSYHSSSYSRWPQGKQ